MGSHPAQAMGIIAFFVAFTALAGGIAGGGVLPFLAGVILLAASIVILRKCKKMEEAEV